MKYLLILLLAFGFFTPFSALAQEDSMADSANEVSTIASEAYPDDALTTQDAEGRAIWAQSDYTGQDAAAIYRRESDGTTTTLVGKEAFNGSGPVTAVGYHDGQTYVLHGNTLSTVDNNHQLHNLYMNVPFEQGYRSNRLAFKDNSIYVTNVAVSNAQPRKNAWYNDWYYDWRYKDNWHNAPCDKVHMRDYWDYSGGGHYKYNNGYSTPGYGTYVSMPYNYAYSESPNCYGQVIRYPHYPAQYPANYYNNGYNNGYSTGYYPNHDNRPYNNYPYDSTPYNDPYYGDNHPATYPNNNPYPNQYAYPNDGYYYDDPHPRDPYYGTCQSFNYRRYGWTDDC